MQPIITPNKTYLVTTRDMAISVTATKSHYISLTVDANKKYIVIHAGKSSMSISYKAVMDKGLITALTSKRRYSQTLTKAEYHFISYLLRIIALLKKQLKRPTSDRQQRFNA